MHELTLIQNILATVLEVAERNHLRVVNKVTLQIGQLRQVVPNFLQFAFTVATQDSIVSGAVLVIEQIPVRIECHDCHHCSTLGEHIYICPECHSAKLEVKSGMEVMIASIEGTV